VLFESGLRKKTLISMVDIYPDLSALVLKVSGLDAPIKKDRDRQSG
jgi:hypothetical protein